MTNNVVINDIDMLNYFMKEYEQLWELSNIHKIINGIKISTITITCLFETKFIIENIVKYLDLDQYSILTIKFGTDVDKIRTLRIINIKKPKGKKKGNIFYNQVTLEIRSFSKIKPINVKIFKNGSIQMTGCKSIYDFKDVIKILCTNLKKTKAIIDNSGSESILSLKSFVEDPKKLLYDKIKNFRIRMINSDFYIGFNINRTVLNKILVRSKIDSKFDPQLHAAVNIKFHYSENETISVFVFESGATIITGAKSAKQIVSAYKFIGDIIYKYREEIKMIDQKQATKILDLLLKKYCQNI